MSLSQEHFDYLVQQIKRVSGMIIDQDKLLAIESRITPVAAQYAFASVEAMMSSLLMKPDNKLLLALAEAVTINESYFFRDLKPFNQFRDVVVPRLLERCPGKQKFRIWSAAASTGQEAYSIAMILKEHPQFAGKQCEIIGTDIASHVLDKARQGLYSQFEVQRGLPAPLLIKYFTQEGENKWRIKEEIRNMVQYQTFNLLNEPGSLGKFDVILCRNVLIYFDIPTKNQILNRLEQHLEPHGVIFLGASESLISLQTRLQTVAELTSVYELKG